MSLSHGRIRAGVGKDQLVHRSEVSARQAGAPPAAVGDAHHAGPFQAEGAPLAKERPQPAGLRTPGPSCLTCPGPANPPGLLAVRRKRGTNAAGRAGHENAVEHDQCPGRGPIVDQRPSNEKEAMRILLRPSRAILGALRSSSRNRVRNADQSSARFRRFSREAAPRRTP